MEKLHGLTAAQVQERIEQGLVNTTYKGAERNEKQIIRDNLFTYFNFLNLALFLLADCFRNNNLKGKYRLLREQFYGQG